MPFADLLVPCLSIAALFFLPAVLIAVGFWVRGNYQRLAERTLERAYDDLIIHVEPEPGDVVLDYYTYHGILIWVAVTPHRVVLPPAGARVLLGRLLRFNLTWGLMSPNVFTVAVIYNYFAQRRSIARQERGSALAMNEHEATEMVVQEIARQDRPPLYRLVFGFLAAMASVLLAVITIALAGKADASQIVISLGMCLVLGWIGYDWLTRPRRKIF